MTVGDAHEAEMMTATLTGYIFASLNKMAGDVLQPPVEFLDCDADGVVQLRLASGMLVTVSVNVEPVIP